ncbi:MAG: SIS domain-containing protein [Anaerolineae bacterium]|nr:SIS domain-containing protein [Thermoflexales bacterium]MDW8406867.1 SIS domain-containing protein [Anaerolineae bacterium]
MSNSTFTSTPESFTPGAHTEREIFSQAESWQSAIHTVRINRPLLDEGYAQHTGRPVLFVACGSPYYLGLSAAAAYRALTGRPALAAPASEVLFNYDSVVGRGTAPLVVAVSRSGETSELLAAVRKLRIAGSVILAITVASHSSLHRLADLALTIPNAEEKSVAQTRSFSAMLIATLGAVAVAGRDESTLAGLHDAAQHAAAYLARIDGMIQAVVARGFRQVYFLGSGARYGLANEGALKMKEMSLTNAEPFHFLEFRHGPQSMVDDQTLVVGLVSKHAVREELQVLNEVGALGGQTLAILPAGASQEDTKHAHTSCAQTEIDLVLPEIAALPFYMPPLHMLAYYQAVRKGLDCDRPRHLKHFISLPNLRAE